MPEPRVITDGVDWSLDEYRRMVESAIYWEKIKRRADFLGRLNRYVVPRPKTYADRKWLEGYCEVAQTFAEMSEFQPHTNAKACSVVDKVVASWLSQGRLSAKDRGQVDAFLDSLN